MAKTKISEWSTTPSSNTDIDGINIAEGCAPSGINDAIRDLMAQVRSWQSGASGDPFNGPMNGTVGATTAYAGAFTTLSASSTVTLSGGTANGVTYLNGSKVLTSGSALTFDGTTLTVNRGAAGAGLASSFGSAAVRLDTSVTHSGNGEVILNAYPTGSPSTASAIVYQLGGSEQMRLTSTGLGIGTSSPSQKLQVKGIVAFEAISGSTNYWANYTYTDNTLRWNYNGAGNDEMTLDSSGNLGLGVTPSAWGTSKAFQIGNRASLFSYNNLSTDVGNNTYFNGSNYTYIQTAEATFYRQNTGAHSWYTAPSGTAGNAITFTQAMTLDANGNLGVGTTSPSDRLHVKGVLRIEDSTDTTTRDYQLKVDTSGNLAFIDTVGPTTKMVLDYAGNLLVGTTSAVYNSRIVIGCASGTQSIAFGVGSGVTRASGTQYGYTLYRDNTTETNAVTFVENGGSGSNASSYVVRTNSGTGGAGVTNVSGGVALVQGATSWSSYSDLRLKHDVVPVTNAIESILKIDPIFFKWNDRPEDQKRSIGVSAQSVEKVFPELIDRSGIYDVEGGAMQVRYTELIPVLLASIQEQQAIIESLKARLDAANL